MGRERLRGIGGRVEAGKVMVVGCRGSGHRMMKDMVLGIEAEMLRMFFRDNMVAQIRVVMRCG